MEQNNMFPSFTFRQTTRTTQLHPEEATGPSRPLRRGAHHVALSRNPGLGVYTQFIISAGIESTLTANKRFTMNPN
jgi:hypothetical protein